jgi:hypothetical protein
MDCPTNELAGASPSGVEKVIVPASRVVVASL